MQRAAMFHHCSVWSSTLYGEEDPPIHLLCLLPPPSPLAVIVGQSLAITKKKEKMTLTITALARVGRKNENFPN